MPFMQPSRIRPLCRSRNPFSPSIALWHHFVSPNQALFHQQRLSSFVTEPAQPIPRDNSGSSTVTASETPSQSGDKDIKHEATHPTIHFKSKLPASFKAKLPKDVVNILVTAQKAASKCEDYHGVIMREVRRSPKLDESTLPWTLPLEERTIPPYARLSIEIQRFHDYMKPNKLETLARKELIERVRRSVQRIANDCTIEIFGSERTGLASATSDIDIRLFRHNTSSNSTLNNLPPSPYERRKLLDALRRLHKALHNNKSYSAPLGITHARYPLLPYTDRRSGLDVQIVLSNDTSHQRAILQQYLQTYPYLDQLYTVIRSFLNVRGLSDVFRGGFGSYPVFMMIVASLQQQPQQGQVEAGEALCSFFEFWSKFDTQTKGISVDPPSVFNKSEYMIMSNATKDKIKEAKITTKPTYMLTLRDPADQTNDLGRQATSMKHFQETCKHIAQKIANDISTGQGSALANLVGSSFMLEQKSRERLRNHGRVVALYNDLPPELVDLANTILEEEQEHKPVKKSRAEEQRPTRRFIKGIKVDDSKKNQRPKAKFTKGIKYDEHAQEELDFPSLVASTEQTPHTHQQEASAEK